jgi:hypothetical protein
VTAGDLDRLGAMYGTLLNAIERTKTIRGMLHLADLLDRLATLIEGGKYDGDVDLVYAGRLMEQARNSALLAMRIATRWSGGRA